MQTVHAYRRKNQSFSVDTGVGVADFAPDNDGNVVAAVEDAAVLEVLMGIPEAYRLLGEAEETKTEKSSFVLQNAGETLDLATLDDAELKAFAKANEVKIHHFQKGNTLRQVIAKHFAA